MCIVAVKNLLQQLAITEIKLYFTFFHICRKISLPVFYSYKFVF